MNVLRTDTLVLAVVTLALSVWVLFCGDVTWALVAVAATIAPGTVRQQRTTHA